jgi:hypothetical protein
MSWSRLSVLHSRGNAALLTSGSTGGLAKGCRRSLPPGAGGHDLMDPTIYEMLIVYAAALPRHQQHLDEGCDRRAWHVLARHLIERAVWSANSTEESVHDGRPLWFNPNMFSQNDH